MSDIANIKSVIVSTNKTKKITRAMELVAASKLGKTQASMAKGRPYADSMNKMIRHVANSNSEYKHAFLEQRGHEKIGHIIISTDRGLCGGLNNNLFRKILVEMQSESQHFACLIGRKAIQFFHKLDIEVVAQASKISDMPEMADIIGIIQNMIKAYSEGKVDRVVLSYNRFVNTMVQKPISLQLLPIPTEQLEADDTDCENSYWDYIYEPDSAGVMSLLLERYIESQVYQAMLENIACEQAARMIAMKNATDNAQKVIDDMKLVYNKARQASITQELSEIVSGAEALD